MMQKGQNNDQLIELGQDVPVHSHKGAKAGRSFSLLLNTIFSRVWKNPLPCICIVLLIASLTFCLVFAPMTGRIAGTAIGSWQGVSQGISEGNKAGTAAGFSAEDTTVKIGTKVEQAGNLQVLLVDLRLTDLYQHGNAYAALWCMKGEGVFSVDLAQSKVSYDGDNNSIIVTIPEPTFTHYFDDSTVDILAEYKPPLFNGSTANGYQGYLNSKDIAAQKIQEELIDYDAMMKRARATALTQVKQLAESVCGSDSSITVCFIDGEE